METIKINSKNKGKFTLTKKRTGKTTEELTHSKNPLTKKRAIFAQNAKKWKYQEGGDLNRDNELKRIVDSLNVNSKADFIKRLNNPNRSVINDWNKKDNIATHKMSYATTDNEDIVYPSIQNIDGILHDFTDPKYKHNKWDAYKSALKRDDVVRLPKGFGEQFTTKYKNYYKTFNKY